MGTLIVLCLSALFITSIVNLLFRVVAFVKEHYLPKRDHRLEGLKTKAVSLMGEMIASFKGWMYAMFSRWHVDSFA